MKKINIVNFFADKDWPLFIVLSPMFCLLMIPAGMFLGLFWVYFIAYFALAWLIFVALSYFIAQTILTQSTIGTQNKKEDK
jgi:hypothetical protein